MAPVSGGELTIQAGRDGIKLCQAAFSVPNNPVTGIIPQGDMSCGIVPFGMIVILFRN